MLIYHYTTGIHLDSILSDGVINLESENPYLPGMGKPPSYVWLTGSERVPFTARPSSTADFMAAIAAKQYGAPKLPASAVGGWYRFIFDDSHPDITLWRDEQQIVTGGWIQAINKTARYQGDNPNHYRVSRKPLIIGEYEPAHF